MNLGELYPKDYLEKAEFSGRERKKLSHEGEAESDGSYPIRNESDLHNAIQAFGRSKNPAKTKAWIKKRAKELGKEDAIPDKWKAEEQELNKAMITLEDYKNPVAGNNPYLVKGFVDTTIPTHEEFLKVLKNNLQKGLIDQETHDKAIVQLDNLLKAGKEGSRGGHVIGHTKSGKPVYAGKRPDDKEYKNFTSQDHLDAAFHHRDKAGEHENIRRRTSGSVSERHHDLSQYHHNQDQHHQQAADREEQNNLSADEKKILAEAKKKQSAHHEAMVKHHNELASLASKHAEKHKGHENAKAMQETADYHKERAGWHARQRDAADNA